MNNFDRIVFRMMYKWPDDPKQIANWTADEVTNDNFKFIPTSEFMTWLGTCKGQTGLQESFNEKTKFIEFFVWFFDKDDAKRFIDEWTQ